MNPLARAAQRAQAQKNFSVPQLLPSFKVGTPMATEFNTSKGIREGYKASSWVYICVRLAMQSVARLPWVVYARKNLGADWEPQPGHPLELLLENPNPFQTRQQFSERTTAHLMLGGNALWSMMPGKVPGTGNREVPVELWTIHPGFVKPIPSVASLISGYKWQSEGVEKVFDAEWMVHMMLTDPENPYWGMSPLQAAARTVDTDIEAVKWNQVTLANRAITDGIFAFDMPLTKEQWEEARERVREQYSGHANARMPWVMGSKASYHQMSLTPVEMDWLESRKYNREEIAAIYQTPLPMIVGQTDSTYANYETARRAYWGDTIVSFAENLVGAVNLRVTPYFGKKGLLYASLDFSGVEALSEDLDAKLGRVEKMVRVGIPLNVAIQRAELDIDPVPGGDIGLVPGGMVPLELAGAPDTVPTDAPVPGDAATRDQVAAAAASSGLNGAQVTALVNIVLQVAQDGLPVNSAAAIIAAAFPQLDAGAIKRILAGVPGYADTAPSPTPAPPAPPPADKVE